MALANRLTNSQVEALKYGIPDHAGNDREWRNDGNGLYIRVRPNGAKSWVLRRMAFNPSKQKSATRKTTLGRYLPGHPEHLSLKDARLEAAQVSPWPSPRRHCRRQKTLRHPAPGMDR